MSSRANRRHHEQRIKRKRFKELKERRDDVKFLTDRQVGQALQCPKDCSCVSCGNPRKYFGEKTRQEIRAEQSY